MKIEEEPLLLDLREFLPGLAGPGWRAGVCDALERALGIVKMREMGRELEICSEAGERPFDAFLEVAGIHLGDHGVEDALPRSGGVLIVANHPFGGADAIALAALVNRVRGDMKVVANAEISRMKALAPLLFPMEIMGQEGEQRRNIAMLRKGGEHLKAGGALVIFPAGAVAHWQWSEGRVVDPPWSEHAARLLLKAQVPVLPVGFSGQNPGWFQFFGALHPLLRSALIPRALMARRGREVSCSAGHLLTPAEFPDTSKELTSLLRKEVRKVLEMAGN